MTKLTQNHHVPAQASQAVKNMTSGERNAPKDAKSKSKILAAVEHHKAATPTPRQPQKQDLSRFSKHD